MKAMCAAALLGVLGLCGVGRGEWIVDGAYTDGVQSGLSTDEKLAVRFVLDQPTVIDSLGGRFVKHPDWPEVPDELNVTASIYSNGPDDWPGDALLSKGFHAPTGAEVTGWHGVSDLNWPLTPGTYWAVFENSGDPVAQTTFEFRRNTDGGVLLPRQDFYAMFRNGRTPTNDDPENPFRWMDIYLLSAHSAGVRIGGRAVPEPGGLLSLSSLAFLAMAIKKLRPR